MRLYLLLLAFSVLLVSVSFSEQCRLGSNLWYAGGWLIVYLFMLLMLYVIANIEVLRFLGEPAYLRNVSVQKAGELGLNLAIVLVFIAYFSTAEKFQDSFSFIPSALSGKFMSDELGSFSSTPGSGIPGIGLLETPDITVSSGNQNIYMKSRPLYFQAARYYVFFMRTLSGAIVFMLNMANGFFHLLSSTQVAIRIKLIGFSFNFGSALTPFLHLLDMFVNGANIAFGHWMLQTYMLDFIECYSLDLIFPLGIILRTFAITRPVGDTLLSFAIGMLFVYPLMLNINAMFARSYYGDLSVKNLIGTPVLSAFKRVVVLVGIFTMMEVVYGTLLNCPSKEDLDKKAAASGRIHGEEAAEESSGLMGALKSKFSSIIKPSWIDNIIKTRNSFCNGPLWKQVSMGLIYLTILFSFAMYMGTLFFSIASHVIFFIVIMSVVWPAINIFVTLMCIKSFAKLFGTDFNLAAIARLL